MHQDQRHRQTKFTQRFIVTAIAASFSAPWAYGAITNTPPIVDTNPPSAIQPPTDKSFDTGGLPVTSLLLDSQVADNNISIMESIIVIDEAEATALNAITGLDGEMGPLPPGSHTVTWTGTDLGNNSISGTQTINILPSVSFAADQTVGEGNSNVTLTAHLSGTAPIYPVTIPFTIDNANSTAQSGGDITLGQDDHTAIDGSIVITSPNTSGSYTFAVKTDAVVEGNETLIFDMTTAALEPDRVVTGPVSTHTITITETNLPPTFNLVATQGGQNTRTIVSSAGQVTLTSSATDPNGDTVNYDWSATDNALVPVSGTTQGTFTFDPAGMTPGFYTVRLTVADTLGASSSREHVLKIIDSAPTLSTSLDTDDDGQNDAIDNDNSSANGLGYQDNDNDGILNYQDGLPLTNFIQAWDLLTFNPDLIKQKSYTLTPIRFDWQVESAASNLVFYPLLLRAEDGIQLNLGPTAFANGQYFARLDVNLAKSYWGATDLNTTEPDSNTGLYDQSTDGQVIDVEISNLPYSGASAYLVIPQPAQLPSANNNYPVLKIMNSVKSWQDFVNDGDANTLATAYKNNAYCPPPKGAYTPVATPSKEIAPTITSPTKGIECIQLRIQDGGPNDYDGRINGVIRFMGAPFIQVSSAPNVAEEDKGVFSGDITTTVTSEDRNKTTPGGGATGAIDPFWLLALIPLLAMRRFKT